MFPVYRDINGQKWFTWLLFQIVPNLKFGRKQICDLSNFSHMKTAVWTHRERKQAVWLSAEVLPARGTNQVKCHLFHLPLHWSHGRLFKWSTDPFMPFMKSMHSSAQLIKAFLSLAFLVVHSHTRRLTLQHFFMDNYFDEFIRLLAEPHAMSWNEVSLPSSPDL